MTVEQPVRPLVLGISGSPRVRSNTRLLLERVLAGAAAAGADAELVALRELQIGSCRHCGGCDRTGSCVVLDDIQEIHAKLRRAQHLVLASPIHFAGVSTEMKAMIDRGQALWVSTYILKRPVSDVAGDRRGVFIATCGGEDARMFEWAKPPVKAFFNSSQFAYWGELFESRTDQPPPVAQRSDRLQEAEALGYRLMEPAGS